MNDVWSILKIEPTDDKKAIRKAYAAQSKLHHPEEEPEYFATLNQAYKAALDYAAGAEKTADSTGKSASDRMVSDRISSDRMDSDRTSSGEGSAAFVPFEPGRKGEREENAAFAPFEPDGKEKRKENAAFDPFEPGRKGEREENAAFAPLEPGGTEEKKENAAFVSFESGGKTGKEGKETLQEKEHEKTEDGNGGHASNNEISLLERLDQASQQAIKQSMETGALREFIVLFENPKQAKQADTWKRFFLSESFLGEQFSEEFAKGLLFYLSEQTLCPRDNLPMYFLQELAIAYAFIPHFAGEEYFEGLKYPKEWYKVSVENTFPARRYAAEIFNMQGRECDLKSMTNHILRQPGNKVRHNAFSDYLTMKEMSRDGRLTDGEKEVWQHVVGACQPYYLYERNGKNAGGADYESRSESVVKLYVQWLKDEQLPREVLLFFYKKLAFKELERSSTRGLYSALKAQVLIQCPQAEEILFGEDGKEQQIVKLYKTYASIINANQTNYDKFIYEETPEIRDRARAFFAMPEWERLKGDKELFERIYGTSKRIVMPKTVTEILVSHLTEGDFPEPERTELIESLLRSLSTERMCRELDYRYEITLGSTQPGDIGDSPDFWQYFLMRGFGFRHAKVRGNWEEDFIYVMDGQCYLPAYINYIYAPSRAWQRQFTGFDQEKEEIREPVSIVCPMPGGGSLRVEFHYHYCLYFVKGSAGEMPVTAPVLAFWQLQEYAEGLKMPEEFFFLLAVTAIEASDRNAARRLIETWLRRIPLHPFLVPTVARMLAADNDRIPGAVPYSGEMRCREQRIVSGDGEHNSTFEKTKYRTFSDAEMAENEIGENKTAENKTVENGITENKTAENETTERETAENEAAEKETTEKETAEIEAIERETANRKATENRAEGKVEAVLYSEQERFCFRAVVSEERFSIWRQMDYGWQDIIFRSSDLGWRKWQEDTWKGYGFSGEMQKLAEGNAYEYKACESNIPADGVLKNIAQENDITIENTLKTNYPKSVILSGNASESNILTVRGSYGQFSEDSTDTPQGRIAAALNILHSLRQPRPRLRASFSLEGMDMAQKAAKILEAMDFAQNWEGFCVLRYGPKKERRHDRVFYGARAPFGFDLKFQSPVYVRSRDYLMSSSNTKIKEPKALAGRFGWGFKYAPRSDYGPMYVYRGESGTFYAYGSIRMHRADSLELLLADFFRTEWEGMTEVEAYEGCLTVSRLDHRLEYCYTEEDMNRSMQNPEDTPADKFTLFGGYGMWKEFVRWMDELLNPGLPSWVNMVVVGIDWEKGGALTFTGFHEEEENAELQEFWEKTDADFEDEAHGDEFGTGEADMDGTGAGGLETDGSGAGESDMKEPDMKESDVNSPDRSETSGSPGGLQNEAYIPQTPLLIWAKGMDRRDRTEFLTNAMQWYADCGRFAEKTGGRNIRILVSGC